MDLSKEEKKSLEGLKQALERKAGTVSGGEVFQFTTGNALWIMRRSCARRLKRCICVCKNGGLV